MEAISNDKEKKIRELKNHFKKEFKKYPETNTSWYISRFLTACKEDEKKTEEKLKDFFEFLDKKNLDDLVKQDFSDLIKVIKRVRYNCDKKGRPIVIQRMGLFQPEEFLKKYKFEDFENFMVKMYDNFFYKIFPVCSLMANKKVDKIFIIIDLKGVDLKKLFDSDFRNILKKILHTSSAYYPETLGKVILLNAPFYFRFIWKIVQYWVDEKTRNNFEIHKDYAKDALKKYVDLENLPLFLGGECKTELEEEPGPWRKILEEDQSENQRFLNSREIELKYFYNKTETQLFYERQKKIESSKITRSEVYEEKLELVVNNEKGTNIVKISQTHSVVYSTETISEKHPEEKNKKELNQNKLNEKEIFKSNEDIEKNKDIGIDINPE